MTGKPAGARPNREIEVRWRGNRMWRVRVGDEELTLHSDELADLCQKALTALLHLPGAPGERQEWMQ
jgi:hypothetical protein